MSSRIGEIKISKLISQINEKRKKGTGPFFFKGLLRFTRNDKYCMKLLRRLTPRIYESAAYVNDTQKGLINS